MLQFKLTGNILEVTEAIFSWHETKITYWYYDIKNWIKSSTGRKDSKPDRKMNDADIAWVKKYYIPKVKNVD